jgi:hypothetical protein
MGFIYSQAASVIVWLGEVSPIFSVSFDAISWLKPRRVTAWSLQELVEEFRCFEQPRLIRRDGMSNGRISEELAWSEQNKALANNH